MTNSEDNNDLEFTSLEWEQESLQLDLRERKQKQLIRWAALCIGCAVLLLMIFILLYHLFCGPLLPKTSEFSWVIIVAPITSITVITVALLVAVFRRYEETDLNKIREGISAGINMMK